MSPVDYNALKSKSAADDAEQHGAASMACRNLNIGQQEAGKAIMDLARALKHLAAAIEFQEKRYRALEAEQQP